jgi:putative ABC transport system ATP-binding protein
MIAALTEIKCGGEGWVDARFMTGPSAEPQKPVFTASNISKIYRSGEVEVHALRDVNIELWKGEIAVLLGPSGSGKSTLLNILGGLDRPTGGNVQFLDHDITSATERELTRFRRDHVGFVFQFYNLLPSLTALENVSLVTEISAHAMRPEEALDIVGLSHRMDHFPAQLSGGEQQRVAIARAISKRPDVLLCDEPTGALDSKIGVLVLEAIDKVNRELGTTAAVITHNVAIQAMAHRVFMFGDGKITASHTNATRVTPGSIHW